MKKSLFLIFFILNCANILFAKTEIDKAFMIKTPSKISEKFTLYSPNIFPGSQISEDLIANEFNCNGKNLSPKVVWKNAPENTRSFAITLYTKDAQTGSGWWHWVIYNIPNDITSIDGGISRNKKLLPKGSVEVINDYGYIGFGGICQPEGTKYNYTLTLYALDADEIDLPKDSTPAMIGLYLNRYVIKKISVTSSYERKDPNKIKNYKVSNIKNRKK